MSVARRRESNDFFYSAIPFKPKRAIAGDRGRAVFQRCRFISCGQRARRGGRVTTRSGHRRKLATRVNGASALVHGEGGKRPHRWNIFASSRLANFSVAYVCPPHHDMTVTQMERRRSQFRERAPVYSTPICAVPRRTRELLASVISVWFTIGYYCAQCSEWPPAAAARCVAALDACGWPPAKVRGGRQNLRRRKFTATGSGKHLVIMESVFLPDVAAALGGKRSDESAASRIFLLNK